MVRVLVIPCDVDFFTGLLNISFFCRYVVLLSKYRAEQPDVTPLSCTFSLLRSKSATADSVVAIVMNVIDSLLSWEDLDMPSADVEPILAKSVAIEITENSMFDNYSFVNIYLFL